MQANPEAEFEAWQQAHGKQFSAEERGERFSIWKDNLEFVLAYNTEHSTHWVRYLLLTLVSVFDQAHESAPRAP